MEKRFFISKRRKNFDYQMHFHPIIHFKCTQRFEFDTFEECAEKLREWVNFSIMRGFTLLLVIELQENVMKSMKKSI